MKKFVFCIACLMIMLSASAGSLFLVDHSISTTSTMVLDLKMNRKYLLIQNKGMNDVYVKLDSVHSGTEGILLKAGGNWEPEEAPYNKIYVKSSSGTNAVVVVEGTK